MEKKIFKTKQFMKKKDLASRLWQLHSTVCWELEGGGGKRGCDFAALKEFIACLDYLYFKTN